MLDRLRKLLAPGRTSSAEWRPVPSCGVYFRNDVVLVIPDHHTETGLGIAGDPVFKLPPAPGAAELGRAVQEALLASAAAKPATLDAGGDAVLAATGFRSWSEMERGARHLSITASGSALELALHRPIRGGWEDERTRVVDAGAAEQVGEAVLHLAASATPRPPAKVRRPAGYAPPPGPTGDDVPQPFGYKVWWLAVASHDPRAVAESLGLSDVQPTAWQQGYAAAGEHFMKLAYVTPSVEGWAFVLFGNVPEDEQSLRAVLEPLSARFGEAQAYANVRTSSAYGWARADAGRLVRAFLSADGEVRIDLGRRTPDEVELGIGDADNEDKPPTEDDVLDIAGRWSINPQELGDQPVYGVGLLGRK